MENLAPFQNEPQARVQISSEAVALVAPLWKEYEKFLIWQKNVAEFMVAQCKWEQEKDLCNERMANPKKGEVVGFFAFR